MLTVIQPRRNKDMSKGMLHHLNKIQQLFHRGRFRTLLEIFTNPKSFQHSAHHRATLVRKSYSSPFFMRQTLMQFVVWAEIAFLRQTKVCNSSTMSIMQLILSGMFNTATTYVSQKYCIGNCITVSASLQREKGVNIRFQILASASDYVLLKVHQRS